jgi:hypothetical protein
MLCCLLDRETFLPSYNPLASGTYVTKYCAEGDNAMARSQDLGAIIIRCFSERVKEDSALRTED